MFEVAAAVTLMGILALTVLRRIEGKDDSVIKRKISVVLGEGAVVADVAAAASSIGGKIDNLEYERRLDDKRRVTLIFEVSLPTSVGIERLIEAIEGTEGVRRFHLHAGVVLSIPVSIGMRGAGLPAYAPSFRCKRVTKTKAIADESSCVGLARGLADVLGMLARRRRRSHRGRGGRWRWRWFRGDPIDCRRRGARGWVERARWCDARGRKERCLGKWDRR